VVAGCTELNGCDRVLESAVPHSRVAPQSSCTSSVRKLGILSMLASVVPGLVGRGWDSDAHYADVEVCEDGSEIDLDLEV
jgi:hypothetical protein